MVGAEGGHFYICFTEMKLLTINRATATTVPLVTPAGVFGEERRAYP